jgi:hypothetical protein
MNINTNKSSPSQNEQLHTKWPATQQENWDKLQLAPEQKEQIQKFIEENYSNFGHTDKLFRKGEIKEGKTCGWRAVIRATGYPIVCKQFERKQEAEDWATSVEQQIRSGQFKFERHKVQRTFTGFKKKKLKIFIVALIISLLYKIVLVGLSP